MLIREAIDLFKAWMREKRPIKYTGRTANANRLARILPLYQKFVLTHLTWFEDNFGYEQTRKRPPGQLAHIYPFFRDHVLLTALREVVSEQRGISLDKVPPQRFMYKKQRRGDGKTTPRSVVGWEVVK